MKYGVLIVCAMFAACESDKHDPVKQITLLRDCIQAHIPVPVGAANNSNVDINLKGGIIVYCENFADVNSTVKEKP